MMSTVLKVTEDLTSRDRLGVGLGLPMGARYNAAMTGIGEWLKRICARSVRALPGSTRSLLGRGATWLKREAGDRSGSPILITHAPPDVPVIDTGRPLPLPDGVSEVQLLEVFSTWSIDGEPPGHLADYVADSFLRFVYTYGLVKNLSGTCLELGANPYFTTYLLLEHSDLDPALANYFSGSAPEISQQLRYVGIDGAERRLELSSRQFNIESDRFPYPDGAFDVVLCCEILEHLLMNPVDMIAEIRRVLSDDGVLVITTPNVARLVNCLRLTSGENIYDPYSGFGPYGRHNREFTLEEVEFLLDFMGFDTEERFVAEGHPCDFRGHPLYDEIAPLVADRQDTLGGYLFVRARKSRPPRDGLPTSLFRSWPHERLVDPAISVASPIDSG